MLLLIAERIPWPKQTWLKEEGQWAGERRDLAGKLPLALQK